MPYDDSDRIDDGRVIEATLDRLEAGFGRDAIHDLLTRFSQNLADAVAAVDRGEGRAIAHRIAGSAGTLGFAALGQYWLAIAEGDDSPVEAARASALQARDLIARRTGMQPPRTTLV